MIINRITSEIEQRFTNSIIGYGEEYIKSKTKYISFSDPSPHARAIYELLYDSKIPRIKELFLDEVTLNSIGGKTGTIKMPTARFQYLPINNSITSKIFILDSGTIMYYKRIVVDSSDDISPNNPNARKTKEFIVTLYFYGLNKQRYYDSLVNRAGKILQVPSRLSILSNGNYLFTDKYSFNNIISKDKKLIRDYFKNWLNMRDFYKQYNMVYKTGIILYGEPGTGKTSYAKAIASLLDYKLEIVDLSQKFVSFEMDSRTVYLFEDIDCILGIDRDTDKEYSETEKAKLQAVLNFIDGVTSIDETVFIATTNHFERLDKALIRPGRFNLYVELKEFDKSDAFKMCAKYDIDPRLVLRKVSYPIKPADLQSRIISYKLKELGIIQVNENKI